MDNMHIYEATRACPPEALRTITAGKLKGKSDINPMWRIKMLTEQFGPCGIGWKTENENFWTTPGAGGEVVAWCSINLRHRIPETGEWSDPVFGIGGSMLVDTQRGNLTSNDEAFKMAHTDAISVACKALGFAADVYWEKDKTKYTAATKPQEPQKPQPKPKEPEIICERCKQVIKARKNRGKVYTAKEIADNARKTYHHALCWDCMIEVQNEQMENEAEGLRHEDAGDRV